MKKALVILVVINCFLSSCQKDYTCVCRGIVRNQDTIISKVKTTKIGSKGYKETCVSHNNDSLKFKDCHLE